MSIWCTGCPRSLTLASMENLLCGQEPRRVARGIEPVVGASACSPAPSGTCMDRNGRCPLTPTAHVRAATYGGRPSLLPGAPMNTKLLIPLCAAMLLAACNNRDDGDAGVTSDGV